MYFSSQLTKKYSIEIYCTPSTSCWPPDTQRGLCPPQATQTTASPSSHRPAISSGLASVEGWPGQLFLFHLLNIGYAHCSKRGFHNSDIFFGLNEVSNVNRDGVAGVTPNQQNVFSLSTVLGQQVASSSPNTDIFNFLQICWFMYDFEMLLQYTLWDDMVFKFKDLKI